MPPVIQFADEHGLLLAIDPGNDGAFAWIDPSGNLFDVADMPIITQGKTRKVMSEFGAKDMIGRHKLSMVIIEQPIPFLKQQENEKSKAMGVVSVATSFDAFGVLKGLAMGMNVPYRTIHPATWKSKSNTPADKGMCRQMAQRFWMQKGDLFSRKRDHGRADAALLGRWAVMALRTGGL